MPLLGALLVNLFGGAFGGAIAWFAKRGATKVAVGVGLTASLAALMLLFNTTVAPLAAAMFNTQYGQFLGLAFPPVAGTCLTAISVVWIGCATFRIRTRVTTANG